MSHLKKFNIKINYGNDQCGTFIHVLQCIIVVLIDWKLLLFFFVWKEPWHWPSLIVLYKLFKHISQIKAKAFFNLLAPYCIGAILSLSCWFFFWIFHSSFLIKERHSLVCSVVCTFKAPLMNGKGNKKRFFSLSPKRKAHEQWNCVAFMNGNCRICIDAHLWHTPSAHFVTLNAFWLENFRSGNFRFPRDNF